MTDPFILTIDYKGEAADFTALYMPLGFSHKFKVLIGDTDVYFEPDEEGLYRVVQVPGQDLAELNAIDKQLLQLIQQKITEVLA